MSKAKKKKSENVYALPTFEDGFYTAGVASANEATGYAVTVPESTDEAKEISSLVGKPETASKRSKRSKDGTAKA